MLRARFGLTFDFEVCTLPLLFVGGRTVGPPFVCFLL